MSIVYIVLYMYNKKVFEVTCRTCAHGRGRKKCKIYGIPITDGMVPGCPEYV